MQTQLYETLAARNVLDRVLREIKRKAEAYAPEWQVTPPILTVTANSATLARNATTISPRAGQ